MRVGNGLGQLRRTVAAHRLVSQCGEDQQRRANDHGVHADIKEQRTGNVNIAQNRQIDVRGVRGHERITQHHGTGSGQNRAQQACAHPA